MQSSTVTLLSQPPQLAVRPEPGLARGLWEAPRWAFVAVLTAAVLGALVYAVAVLRRRRATR